MKTLAHPPDQQEIRTRLARLTPASERLWGSMTVTQMLCHVADSYELPLGRRTAKPAPVPGAGVVKQMALWAPMQWPHGLKTLAEVDATRPGAQPGSFAEEQARLLGLLEEFTLSGDLDSRPHPMFGTMSAKDWLRWGYLHPDHHLRQFGA